MTRVTISEDCGNSPKNIFVQELTIAFAKADSRFLLKNVTDDVLWNILGDQDCVLAHCAHAVCQLLRSIKIHWVLLCLVKQPVSIRS